MDDLDRLIKKLNEYHWVEDVRTTQKIWELNDRPSVRKLAVIIGKPKSWVSVTLMLAKGLELIPNLEKESSRNSAYKRVKKLKKLSAVFSKVDD